LLLAILFWFTGYGAIETFFTSYGEFYLGIGASTAAFALGFFSISFLIFAIPSGIIATKIGRKKTILIGMTGLLVVFGVFIFVQDVGLSQILLLVAGLLWALVNINSYPMLMEMTTDSNIGAYTGLYYFFSSLAAIVGPTLFGFLKDIFGYSILFGYTFTFFIVAYIFILFVKKGEVA